MPKVFISYRREDCEGPAAAIAKALATRLGATSVVLDADIAPGVEWRRYLMDAVAECDVLLALIGDQWRDAVPTDGPRAGQQRLHDPTDFLRFEIETALRRGITVIPVLVGTANVPRATELPGLLSELAEKQAITVRPGDRFESALEQLVSFIAQFSPRLAPETLKQLMSENASRIIVAYLRIPDAARPEYVEWLATRFRSASELDRLAALMALAEIRCDGIELHLRRASKDGSDAVRRLAVHYIGRLRLHDELRIVAQLMSDGSPMVRAAARDAHQALNGS